MGVTFEPPAPGHWTLDRSHYPGAVTPISQWLMRECMSAGMERVFREIGAPIRRIDAEFVNGFMYTRVRPLIGADRPATRLPPTVVLKVVTHLHPEFRRRARRADATLSAKPYLDVARDWEERIRPRLREANRRLQEVDLGELPDDSLQGHVDRLLDHCREQLELHFWLHGHDLGPLARLVHESERWGLDAREVAGALVGASPSTAGPARTLERLRSLVEAAGAVPATLDDVRSCSPEAAELLDDYLAEHGAVLATGYDITSFTLGELPGTVLTSIRTASPIMSSDPADTVARLRDQVPETDRTRFDDHLADARAVMDMRDDNGPLTAEWPLGLLRLALLEAGRRLADRGLLDDAEHVLELEQEEARRLFDGSLPPAAVLRERADRRIALASVDPPPTLGPTEPEPPLDVLPKPLPTLVGMVQTAMRHLGMDGGGMDGGDMDRGGTDRGGTDRGGTDRGGTDRGGTDRGGTDRGGTDGGALDGRTAIDPLAGVGIGTVPYTGTVRTAASADEAIERLEPGEVLVVRATSPAFNAVLAIAGAVVTSHGGALSHAAVLARELGFPAVVGAPGALGIADGATVEVDPVAGRVRVVD